MRSSAYTDFIKIDIPEATYIDFYVPYEEGHHLQSMDKVLSQVKLGDPAESSFFGKAYAMVSFVAEQLSMRKGTQPIRIMISLGFYPIGCRLKAIFSWLF